jgi:hypothetical protein
MIPYEKKYPTLSFWRGSKNDLLSPGGATDSSPVIYHWGMRDMAIHALFAQQ